MQNPPNSQEPLTEPAPPTRHRIVICRGVNCNASRRADKILQQVEPLVADLNAAAPAPRFKLEIAQCLNMCSDGPNAVIYPDRLVFNSLTPEVLVRVICEDFT
jgi:NADH:ubiquinone oxidoreductase subunit E